VQVTSFCGIPTGAASVAGNLTAISPSNVAFLVLSAADENPPTSTLNYKTGVTRANNFVMGLSATGQLRVAMPPPNPFPIHATLDVSGYFMAPLNMETWTLTFREEGNRISSEYLGATRQKDYFYLGNLLVATRTGTGAGTYLYYASDHLGTPRLVTNSSIPGAKVEDHRYDAFGIELTATFGNQPLKFAAMERDSLSKNDYDHARYQSSDLGRFLSPDLLGGTTRDPQSWNRYSYARNNPISFVDPDGNEPASAHEVAGLFFEAAARVDNLGASFPPALGLAGVSIGLKSAATLLDAGTLTGEAVGSGASTARIAAAIGTDLATLTGGFLGIRALLPGITAAVSTSSVGPEVYNRRLHYPSSPTAADRRALGAGPGEVVNHEPPLVKRYYEGDPSRGEGAGSRMTAAERRESAADRSRMNLQSRRDSCAQGADCSRYSRRKKLEILIRQGND
jgi:RHS repeat-associated protein